MERKAWFGSDGKGSKSIADVTVEVIDTYESFCESIENLYNQEFTPESASAKIIQYYEDFWEEEKMVGEDYL